MMKPQISILTVLYDSAQTLSRSLITWREAILGSSATIEILATENSLESNSQKLLLELNEVCQARYFSEESNVGFAKAVNQMAQMAEADWLLILNPDVFLTPTSLQRISKVLESSSGNTVYSLNLTDESGVTFSGIGLNATGILLDLPAHKNHKPLGPTGAATLIKRSLFLELGGYQGALFMWLEDAEFALRLNSRGIDVISLDLGLRHLGSHSLSSRESQLAKSYFMARNRVWLLRSRFTLAYRNTVGLVTIFLMIGNLMLRKLPKGHFLAYASGLLTGIFGKIPNALATNEKFGLAWYLRHLKATSKPIPKV
jgi:N-acetylglucosaminyl-diphospho-decaprenol L-rhamnosyltransferase